MHSNKLYGELEWSFYQIHDIHCRNGFYLQNVGLNLVSYKKCFLSYNKILRLQYVLLIKVLLILPIGIFRINLQELVKLSNVRNYLKFHI